MMDEQQKNLARGFTKLPWWRWRERMQAIGPDGRSFNVLRVRDYLGYQDVLILMLIALPDDDDNSEEIHADECYPDLDDDLTLHGIECMLRDKLGAVHVWCEPDGAERWSCYARRVTGEVWCDSTVDHPDRRSALLAACEATR